MTFIVSQQRSTTANARADRADPMGEPNDEHQRAQLEAVADEIGQHERDALAEMDERDQSVLDEQRANELATADDLEASGYWQSGYIDSVTGETHEFDPKQDWDDAFGQVIDTVYNDLWEDAGTLAQQDGARTILRIAEDCDPIEIDLGSRHYFVREVAAQTETEAIADIQERHRRAQEQSEQHGQHY